MDRKASLPTRFMSSPWPAMPTTSVPKSSGTMSDLIIRRKIVDRTCRSVALKPAPGGGGKKTPTEDPDDKGAEDPLRLGNPAQAGTRRRRRRGGCLDTHRV